MPILGVVDSGKLKASLSNSYESIATTTVGAGGSASITFSSIPSTYKHLQIRAIVRSTFASTSADDVYFKINGDTTTNWFFHKMEGNGATITLTYGTAVANDLIANTAIRANSLANDFGALTYDVFDYANTNKYKTARALYGMDLNGSGTIGLHSGTWPSTSAISSINISVQNNNIAQNSSFALYGIL